MSPRRVSVLLFLLIAWSAPAGGGERPGPGKEGTVPARISGRVTREGLGTAGAVLYAYKSFQDTLAARPFAVSEKSDEDGYCSLELPAGNYYLVAKKMEGDGDGSLPVGGYHSFHGLNPFTLLPGAEKEVRFSLSRKAGEATVAPSDDPASGTLTGRVTFRGKGLDGVGIKLYLDADGDFRGMGFASAPPTDESGAFRFDFLPESGYYVIARKRSGGFGAGPLTEGDYYGYFADNPVRVKNGSITGIEIEMVTKGRDEDVADGRPRASGTRISGRITDARGAATGGAYAFAYEEKVMAHKKPAFLSPKTGEDGRYVIHLSRGGTFYVGARSAYGDSPAKGEWYGRYDETPDHSVEVRAGEWVKDIDIVVERILP